MMFGLDKTATRIVQLGAIVVVLLFAMAVLSMCNARSARNDARIAAATGKALDKVAEQTPAIRQEQEEKQRAVDDIQGADQPLPPGFGSDLERVRRGERNPR
jgi:hypothetical protein